MSPTNTPGNAPESSGHDSQADLRADLSLLSDEELGSETVDDTESGDEPAQDNETDELQEGEEESQPDEAEEDEGDEGEEKDGEEEPTPTDILAHPRPTVKQIKDKFPEFFKQFPEMRHMLFREQEYTQLFPTVEDAKDASSRAQDFDMFSNLLQSGKQEDFSQFLKGVREAGDDTLNSMAANFLPSLYTANKDLYFQVTTPIAESMLKNAFKAAKAAGNTNLENAALHLAQWALGDAAFATGEKSTPKLQTKAESKDPQLEQEKQAFYKEKYDDAQTYVKGNSFKRLEREVKSGLDPNGVFNEFTSKLLSKQILDELGQQLEGDQQHMATMNSLWKQAHKAGYVGNWKDRILTTYLSRARTYLPAIRARIRAEALKGQETRHNRTNDVANRSSNRKEVSGSQNSGQRSSNAPAASKGKVDWSKTSDMDFLNDKVTFKR